MARKVADTSKQEKKKAAVRWVAAIFVITIFLSGGINLVSDSLMSVSSMGAAFCILLAIVLLGILFDAVGVAVTSADEKPFHSMASRKVPGAREAIDLLRNAGRVSSFCNDVVGDICGVVSGSASAAITVRILASGDNRFLKLVALGMSSLVAGLTVGGKAVGKQYAISCCTEIVHWVGKLLYMVNRLKKGKKRKPKSK